ncbi:MAG: hypothetical protein R3D02_14990 [Hyphomicrobiales bacterium]
MALLLADIRPALSGSLLVLQNRQEGLRLFDLSIDGFWRSFAVVLLVLPLIAPVLVADRIYVSGMADAPETTAALFYGVELLSLAIGWVTFPLVMVPVARWLGLGGRYVPFIVVHNWSALLPAMPFSAAAVFYLSGFISISGFSFFALVVLAFEAVLRYRIARIALAAKPSLAVAVTLIDLQIGFLIDIGLFRLIGV